MQEESLRIEYAEEARQAKEEGAKIGGLTAGRGSPKSDSPTEQIRESYEEPNDRRTDAKLAATYGTNSQYIAKEVGFRNPLPVLLLLHMRLQALP